MSAAPALDPAKIIKQGFLNKQGGKVQSWKNRYFALHESNLYYYKAQDLKENLGVIPILDCTVSLENPPDNHGFYFMIKLPQSSAAHRNEFLLKAATEEERKSWIDAINKANIITLFGHPLVDACRVNPEEPGLRLSIPYFFKQAIEFLEKNSLSNEGLYRLNGSSVQIETLQNRINNNLSIELNDANVATGLIKSYLRSLPEPLFLYANYQALKKISQMPEEKQVAPLRHIIRNLPVANFVLIIYFFAHLRRVMEREETNKMNNRAISVCIGPSLVRVNDDNASEAYGESNVQQTICVTLLMRYEEIFTKQPLMVYNSTGNTKIVKLIREQSPEYPFTIQNPVGTTMQIVAEDSDGWCIAVVDSLWGVVHRTCVEPIIQPREVLKGLGEQKTKWSIPSEELSRIGSICPEAIQLYEVLSQKVNALRDRAREAK